MYKHNPFWGIPIPLTWGHDSVRQQRKNITLISSSISSIQPHPAAWNFIQHPTAHSSIKHHRHQYCHHSHSRRPRRRQCPSSSSSSSSSLSSSSSPHIIVVVTIIGIGIIIVIAITLNQQISSMSHQSQLFNWTSTLASEAFHQVTLEGVANSATVRKLGKNIFVPHLDLQQVACCS